MTDDKLPSIGLFLLAPLLAFLLIATNGLSRVVEASATISDGEAISEFAARLSGAIDALQAERSNATVLLSNTDYTLRQQFQSGWSETDRVIAALRTTPGPNGQGLFASAETLAVLESAIEDLPDLRRSTLDGTIALDDEVDGYTRILDALTLAFAAEFTTHEAATSHFSDAFIALARLHERHAVETGIGLTAFYTGRITPDSHQLFIEAGAAQDALEARFARLAGPDWAAELDAVLEDQRGADLTSARRAIIAGGYHPDGEVDQSSRTWWRETRLPVYFQLGVLRSRYAQDGVRDALQSARTARDRAALYALLQSLALFLASAASIYGLTRLTGTAQDR